MTSPSNAVPPGNLTHRTFLNDQNRKEEVDSKVEADNGWLARGLKTFFPNPHQTGLAANKTIINGFGGNEAHSQILSFLKPHVKSLIITEISEEKFKALESNIDAILTAMIANAVKACYEDKLKESTQIRNPIQLILDLAEFFFDIIQRHASGKGNPYDDQQPFREQFANIEEKNISEEEKIALMSKLLEPCMNEIYYVLMPNGIEGVSNLAYLPLTAILHVVKRVFVSPEPLIKLFRKFFGVTSIGDFEIRKKQFQASDDGACLLDFIHSGVPLLVQNFFPALLLKISKDNDKEHLKKLENHPLKNKLIPFLTFVAEASSINLLSRICRDKLNTPVQRSFLTLIPIFGIFFQKHGQQLKIHYREHFQLAKESELLQKQSKKPIANHFKEKPLFEAGLKESKANLQNKKKDIFKNLVHVLWDTLLCDSLPIINSWNNLDSDAIKNKKPAEIKKLEEENSAKITKLKDETLPTLIVSAFDSLIEFQPGLIEWLAPEKNNEFLRKDLSLVPTGSACEPWATVAADFAIDPLFNLLESSTLGIPSLLIEEIDKSIVVKEKSKNHLQALIGSLLETVAEHDYAHATPPTSSGSSLEKKYVHSFKGFAYGNMQSIALFILNTIGQSKIKIADKDQPFNLIETLCEGILNIIEEFRISPEGIKALAANKPAELSEKMQNDHAAKQKYEKELETYHNHFEILYKKLLEFTGAEKLLSNKGMLCVFGLDTVIKKELLKKCANICVDLQSPLSQPPVILQNLAKSLYDSKFVANVLIRHDKFKDLIGLGTSLEGKTPAAVEEILRITGSTDAANLIYSIMNQLGDELTDVIHTQLGMNYFAEKIHHGPLKKTQALVGRSDVYTVLDNAIHALVKKRTIIGKDASSKEVKVNGISAAFSLLATYMTPALNRGLVNFINSTRPFNDGHKNEELHAKQLFLLDMLARIAAPLQETIAAAEKNQEFLCLRDQSKKLNDLIMKNEKILNEADYKTPKQAFETSTLARKAYPREAYFKESSIVNPEVDCKYNDAIRRDANVNEEVSHNNGTVKLNFNVNASGEFAVNKPETDNDILYRETQQAKKELSDINTKLTEIFLPAAKVLLKMLVSSEKDGNLVTNIHHPLHHLPLPSDWTQDIWDNIVPDALSFLIASHYCKLVPNIKMREKELHGLTKIRSDKSKNETIESDAISTLCKHFAVIAKVATRDLLKSDSALKKDPKKYADELVKAGLDAFQNQKQIHDLITAYQDKIIAIVSVTLKTLGTSNHPFFNETFWPMLEKITYPMLLTLAIRFMERVNKADTAENRVTLGSEIIEMLATFVDTKNKAEHPVITPILNDDTITPERESEIISSALLTRAKVFFNKINFTFEDLPLEERMQKSVFPLIEKLGSVLLGSLMNMIFTGRTRDRLDGHYFNLAEIDIWKNMLAKQKTSPSKPEKIELDNVKSDTHMVKLIRHILELIPDPIAGERFFVAPYMDQGAEALDASWRKECREGRYVELIVLIILKILLPKLCEEKDGILTFEIKSVTPEDKAKAAAEAKSLFSEVFSEAIINGLKTWFYSKGQAFEDFIDTVCDAIDRKIDSSVKFAKTIGDALKAFFRWLATAIIWLLYPILWLIKAIIQWRVGVTSDIMHEKRDDPHTRVAGWHLIDIPLGRDELKKASAQISAAAKRT